MNLPNKLTILRILIVPFMVAAMLIEFPFHFFVSGLLFGAASLTDYFDGKIARERNLITNFGKFADPIADKILVISALICFLALGLCDPVLIIIVLFREFVVTSVRLTAASQGKVVAANIWGKVKTVSQIIAIVAVFVFQFVLEIVCLFTDPQTSAIYSALSGAFYVVSEIALWISTVFAIISGLKYVLDNKDAISQM
ncbi:MAG: CDP-diacylglycerol--glycerol-3-phosphate 3-phosphatidyltransferase [Ruminococcus sp.]|nr:CDP-diacylglycerol--glycerol-3-phosphate 3-phosphatidyltransferase [Ruminococcus sp.]